MKANETIHFETKTITPKYNAFQGGYGCHEKSKKAKHKADRKNAKKMCLDY